jgi:hypothetical protein
MQPDTSALYFREAVSVRDEIASERVIFIKRVLIDPPEREQEDLAELAVEPEIGARANQEF